jgi:hypothetical protein
MSHREYLERDSSSNFWNEKSLLPKSRTRCRFSLALASRKDRADFIKIRQSVARKRQKPDKNRDRS